MTVQGHDRWLYVHFKGNDHDRTIIYFLFDLTRKPVKNTYFISSSDENLYFEIVVAHLLIVK